MNTLNGDTNEYNRTWDGVIPMLKQRYREAWGDAMREELETFMSGNICPDCHGSRLKPEVLSILVGGKNINDVTQMTVRDAQLFQFVAADAPAAGHCQTGFERDQRPS